MKKHLKWIVPAAIICCASIAAVVFLLPKGHSLTEYSIVYQESDSTSSGTRISNCVHELQKYVFGKEATMLPLKDDDAAGSEREILIGETNRPETAAAKDFVTPMDYTIQVTDTKIVVVGGSPFATAAATDKFLQLLDSKEIVPGKAYTYQYAFNVENINPICLDASAFTPQWKDQFTVPEWMLDRYEGLYALTHKTNPGRLAVLGHRGGDFTSYPENSLEGILSAGLAGTDAIEMDFRLTKDNIPVLLHYESMIKETDCGAKMGKNGLPNSEWVGDWTYDQLRELNLCMTNGAVTEYKIATVYEGLLLGKYVKQLTLDDKADETEHPVFAATTYTEFEDVLPLALATDSLHSLLYYYTKFKNYTDITFWENIEGASDEYYQTVQFWSKCLNDGSLNGIFATWDSNDSRYKSWGYDSQLENEKWWDLWYKEGTRVFWSNRSVDCCRYLAEKSQPYDYSALLG